jgi:hypothetical protein
VGSDTGRLGDQHDAVPARLVHLRQAVPGAGIQT